MVLSLYSDLVTKARDCGQPQEEEEIQVSQVMLLPQSLLLSFVCYGRLKGVDLS
jgi:hypothetical protein